MTLRQDLGIVTYVGVPTCPQTPQVYPPGGHKLRARPTPPIEIFGLDQSLTRLFTRQNHTTTYLLIVSHVYHNKLILHTLHTTFLFLLIALSTSQPARPLHPRELESGSAISYSQLTVHSNFFIFIRILITISYAKK
jgi:hypothetical protein